MAEQPIDSLPALPPQPRSPPMPAHDPAYDDLDAEEREFLRTLPPMLVRSKMAFRRELPRLLSVSPHLWVAFSGDRQIAEPDRSKTKLYQQCLQMGLREDEFLVLPIEPRAARFLADCDL